MEVKAIDPQVLNLVGAAMGMDFNSTVINSSTEIELAKGGQVVTASGQFGANKFSLTQKGQTSPPLDLQVACNLTVNTAEKSARL